MVKRSGVFWFIIVMLIIASLPSISEAKPPIQAESDSFTLNIWHTNDQHAHHRPDQNGVGGSARLATVIQEARATQENVLLLDAGDRFSGTLFHFFYQGQDNVQVMNLMEYDAMALGNHEFDNGSDVLAEFINGVDFPVLAANIDTSDDPYLSNLVEPYTIIDVNGEEIGIIGLVTPRTAFISKPWESIVFLDDLEAVTTQAVNELEALGVNKIILLTHVGYREDLELAEQVAGVDIIIGGHSNTIPNRYPLELMSASDEPILVVQAGFHSLFVGHLEVSFYADGKIVASDGRVLRLDADIAEDEAMLALIDELEAPVAEFTDQVVGQTAIAYRRDCYGQDCDLGALVGDAMLDATNADLVIHNSGGLRDDLPVGDVTYGDILSVLPFGNQISVMELSGEDVWATLEYGVSKEVSGKFPQVAGMRFSWSPSAPSGERIVSVDVWNPEIEDWEALDLERIYVVATHDFMRGGGDGYTVLVENAMNPYDSFGALDEVVADYITANSPVNNIAESRIRVAP